MTASLSCAQDVTRYHQRWVTPAALVRQAVGAEGKCPSIVLIAPRQPLCRKISNDGSGAKLNLKFPSVEKVRKM